MRLLIILTLTLTTVGCISTFRAKQRLLANTCHANGGMAVVSRTGKVVDCWTVGR